MSFVLVLSKYLIYQRFLLTVRVMWDSITAWSTYCDLSQRPELRSWLCEWSLLLSVVARVKIEIVDHVWNMKWPSDVTNSTNIGGSWWIHLQKLSYSSRKNWLREDKHHREKRMVLKIFWTLFLLGGVRCECLRKILMARDTCLDPGVGQILTTTPTYA